MIIASVALVLSQYIVSGSIPERREAVARLSGVRDVGKLISVLKDDPAASVRQEAALRLRRCPSLARDKLILAAWNGLPRRKTSTLLENFATALAWASPTGQQWLRNQLRSQNKLSESTLFELSVSLLSASESDEGLVRKVLSGPVLEVALRRGAYARLHCPRRE